MNLNDVKLKDLAKSLSEIETNIKGIKPNSNRHLLEESIQSNFEIAIDGISHINMNEESELKIYLIDTIISIIGIIQKASCDIPDYKKKISLSNVLNLAEEALSKYRGHQRLTVGFRDALTTFLATQLNEYQLIQYKMSPIDDDGIIEVTTWVESYDFLDDTNSDVNLDYSEEHPIILDSKNSTYWRWNSEESTLELEMDDRTNEWKAVTESGPSVKHFWIMVAPYLFKD